ncbi:hypothetical protein J6590_020468 [Homalodisca vitripennis]|nr:hypothetical protein J6590_020468 [Homalodisca vitripennis]
MRNSITQRLIDIMRTFIRPPYVFALWTSVVERPLGTLNRKNSNPSNNQVDTGNSKRSFQKRVSKLDFANDKTNCNYVAAGPTSGPQNKKWQTPHL